LENSKKKQQIWLPLLLALMVVVGMIGGYRLNDAQDADLIRFFPGEKNVSVGEVEEALRFLDNKYLYNADDEELTRDALEQIFSRLDPFSMYIPPEDLVQVNNNMNGNYKGIGIETLIIKDTLLITRVLKESPAEAAGLQKLDRIIALNGKNLTGDALDFPYFRKHFQQQKDSSTLSILRRKNRENKEVKLLAKNVETHSINHHFMLDDSTLYVRIDQFISKTYREFMEVLEDKHVDKRIPRLIIDLRDNPGGYLGEVTKILSQFFDEADRTLVRTTVKNGQERKYETTGRTFFNVGKIIVLMNKNSASGSEVLAGALQDWDRALIIGRESYGKGLVQEQYPLSNGGALRLTVANYFLPTGRSIQEAFPLDSNYFNVDSIWDHGKNEYFSLIHHRPLTSANGIEPDILVQDSFYEKVFYPSFYGDFASDEWVLDYLDAYPELYDIEPEKFRDDYEPDESNPNFQRFKALHDSLDKSSLGSMFKAKLAYYLFEDESVIRILLSNDPDLRVALEKMEEEDWFSEG
jgi:carboxyl-terminal processing protease